MNAQEECLNFEIIRAEAGNTDNANPRLLVNPDFVEGQDTSDGKTQWNKEDEERIWNEI